jgi:hypothetical protein
MLHEAVELVTSGQVGTPDVLGVGELEARDRVRNEEVGKAYRGEGERISRKPESDSDLIKVGYVFMKCLIIMMIDLSSLI